MKFRLLAPVLVVSAQVVSSGMAFANDAAANRETVDSSAAKADAELDQAAKDAKATQAEALKKVKSAQDKAAAAVKEATATGAGMENHAEGAAQHEVANTQLRMDAEKEEIRSDWGLLGPVSLGPTVGIALPHPANVGLEGRVTDYIGFGANYGFLPEVTISNAKAKLNSYDFRARVFPFGGSFFVGAGIGKQNLTGSQTTTISSSGITGTVTPKIEVGTTYVNPTLGWRWGGRHGFVAGLDLGWQFAMSNTSTLTVDSSNNAALTQLTATAEYQKIKTDVEKVGNDIGKKGLPTLTLLQIGYLF